MSAFAGAAAAIYADLNFGEDALYRPLGRGPGIPLRVIRSVAGDDVDLGGRSIRVKARMALSVLASACTPCANDTFELVADGTRTIVLDAELDAEGTEWTIACRLADVQA